MSGIIAHRYAKALMNLAVQADAVDAVAEGLDDIAELLPTAPRLGTLMADSRLPLAVKQELMREISTKVQLPPLVDTFLRYLTAKRRFVLLPEICSVFHQLADARLGRAQAQVTVAAPLNAEQEARLQQCLAELSGKQISLAIQVDPEIIGGVITRIGSVVRDGSLRCQLGKIGDSLREG